jgi:hypothetical protein
MSFLLTKPKHNIYITTIGAPGVGKTTALSFIAEFILDKDKICCCTRKSYVPNSVVLVDNLITSAEELNKVSELIISIKITRKGSDRHWSDTAKTDLFIWNDESLRLFNRQLLDLYISGIKIHKLWKAAMNGQQEKQ